MTRRLRNRRGVTLVELIVSLVVLSMMALVGNAAFSYLIHDREAIAVASTEVERASSLRDLIHTWLLAAQSVNTAPQNNTGLNSSQGSLNINGVALINPASITGDALNFTTTADTPAHAPTTIMRLFVDDDDNTPEVGLTLEYRITAQLPLARIQLDPSITELHVEYLNNQTNQWIAATDVSGTVQARGVRLTMYGSEDGYTPGIISLPIITALPVAAQQQQQGGGQ